MSYQKSTTKTPKSKPIVPWVYVIVGIVVAVILAILMGWLVIWLAANHGDSIEVLRDLFMIGLALTSCVFGVVTMMLLVMVVRLVNMLEHEIKPILEKTNETVGTLRGTTSFVSKNVVEPVVTASSYTAGARRALKVLFGRRD